MEVITTTMITLTIWILTTYGGDISNNINPRTNYNYYFCTNNSRLIYTCTEQREKIKPKKAKNKIEETI